jgi:uncharacterized protein
MNHLKTSATLFVLLLLCPLPGAAGRGNTGYVKEIRLEGYVGKRIDDCVRMRVMQQNIDEITNVFFKQDELRNSWKTEFWGKWVQGAIEAYKYKPTTRLYNLIETSVGKIKDSQLKNGYIGNYDSQHQLQGWDVWGRKYTMLGLLKWYALSKDKGALRAACRLLDYTMTQIGKGKAHIYDCGNCKGMAPTSILEPVMLLYKETGNGKYLDFAKFIVEDIETGDGPHLISKCDEPVYKRYPVDPSQWWAKSNGQKAYEMMSCYVGIFELGKAINKQEYIDAAITAVRRIEEEEISICGSGSAYEHWYHGKVRQTMPACHFMETCVSFTWMQINNRLLQSTRNPHYADNIEQTFYNAVLAAMKDDASQIVKYTPLEGYRMEGEHQCGLSINCCNANGPRAYAMIPHITYGIGDDRTLYSNFYIPSNASVVIDNTNIAIRQETEYPRQGTVRFTINPEKEVEFNLALRIPQWSKVSSVKVNGTECKDKASAGSYYPVRRLWRKGDVVELSLDMRTRLTELNHMQALQRGPVTLARDSRFHDGFVDETCRIDADKDGYVDAKLSDTADGSFWMALEIPARKGTYKENVPRTTFHVCDFASAGSTWNPNERYRVWLPKTIDLTKEPIEQ